MTAMPSAASSRRIEWIVNFEPISTPTVGPLSISTSGLVASHLARTTFCWLPPDSVLTALPGSGVAISRSDTQRACSAAMAFLLTPPRALVKSDSSEITMFSPMERDRNSPSVRRSSGT